MNAPALITVTLLGITISTNSESVKHSASSILTPSDNAITFSFLIKASTTLLTPFKGISLKKEPFSSFEFKYSNIGRIEEIERHSADIKRLESEIEKAKVKRRRLFDDYDDGVYTASEFKERKEVWADRIDRMTHELEQLNKLKPMEIDYKEKALKFSNVLKAVEDIETTAKTKNDLLKEIITRIDYYCEDLGRNKGGIVTLDIILKD